MGNRLEGQEAVLEELRLVGKVARVVEPRIAIDILVRRWKMMCYEPNKVRMALSVIAMAGVMTWRSLPAVAGPMASLHRRYSGGIAWVSIAPSFFLTYAHNDSPTDPPDNDDTSLFDDIILTLDDVGTTFMASTDPHSDFLGFVSMLTNGVDDDLGQGSRIRAGLGGGSSNGIAPESRWFSEFLLPGSVDFSGHQIDEISLTLETMTFDTPGHDPNGDGVWTDYTADVTFTIVPEPLTLWMLGTAIVITRRRRRKVAA